MFAGGGKSVWGSTFVCDLCCLPRNPIGEWRVIHQTAITNEARPLPSLLASAIYVDPNYALFTSESHDWQG